MKKLEQLGYLSHFQTSNFKVKLRETQDIILSHSNYATSISWGKDSTVLAHIASQLIQNHVILHGKYLSKYEHIADMDKVKNSFLSRDDMSNCDYHDVNMEGKWEMFKQLGYGFITATTKEEKQGLKFRKHNYSQQMLNAMASHNCKGHLLGLCSSESKGRRMNNAVRGHSYTKKDGTNISNPLSKWSGKDIWAYITKYNLPYLKIYDESERGRERARSGFYFVGSSEDYTNRFGVWREWEKTYPYEFNAWIINWFPNLSY